MVGPEGFEPSTSRFLPAFAVMFPTITPQKNKTNVLPLSKQKSKNENEDNFCTKIGTSYATFIASLRKAVIASRNSYFLKQLERSKCRSWI